MENNVLIYNKETIDQISWPLSEVSAFAQDYLIPLIVKGGVVSYFNNVQTDLRILIVNDLVLPITINEAEWNNAYVCSPYTHYVTYAKEELKNLHNAWLEAIIGALLSSIGFILKQTKFNQVVTVNNWLLSTNLYPEISREQLASITNHLKEKYPHHAIIFRSLNYRLNKDILNLLDDVGYQKIISRVVYISDPNNEITTVSEKRHLRNDSKLLPRSEYVISNKVTNIHAIQIKKLYDLLYLKKYSRNNPQFNENFFKLIGKVRNFSTQALVKNHVIQGFASMYHLNGVIASPALGYNTSLNKKDGLYRMLSASMYERAVSLGLIFHESSGVSEFKSNRGAKKEIEYSMVYLQHLPLYRAVGWYVLMVLFEYVGLPLIRKYDR